MSSPRKRRRIATTSKEQQKTPFEESLKPLLQFTAKRAYLISSASFTDTLTATFCKHSQELIFFILRSDAFCLKRFNMRLHVVQEVVTSFYTDEEESEATTATLLRSMYQWHSQVVMNRYFILFTTNGAHRFACNLETLEWSSVAAEGLSSLQSFTHLARCVPTQDGLLMLTTGATAIRFDFRTMSYSQVTTDVAGVELTAGSSMTSNPSNQCCYSYGGYGRIGYSTNLLKLDYATMTWSYVYYSPEKASSIFSVSTALLTATEDTVYSLRGRRVMFEVVQELNCFNLSTGKWDVIKDPRWQLLNNVSAQMDLTAGGKEFLNDGYNLYFCCRVTGNLFTLKIKERPVTQATQRCLLKLLNNSLAFQDVHFPLE